MNTLFKTKSTHYNNLRTNHIKLNTSYISQHFKLSTRTIPNIKFTKFKNIIPLITKMPRYILYTHTLQSYYTEDDNILRFIPYIHKKGKIEGVFYENISFASQKISKNLMIVRLLILDIIDNYCDDKLYNIIIMKIEDNLIKKVADIGNVNYENVIEWLGEIFYRSRRRVSSERELMEYFCGVCYLFNCKMHGVVKDCGVRKADS